MPIEQQLFDPAAKVLAQKLQKAYKKAPTVVGMESPDGTVIAEMAWEAERIAALTEEQAEYAELLQHDGWKTYMVDDPELIDRIQEV